MDSPNTTPPADNAAPAPEAPAAAPAPEAPAAPAAPAAEAPAPGAVPPVNADVANAVLNPPANPVVTPAAPGAAPAAAPAPTMSMNQMFAPQPQDPTSAVFDESTAIAKPEGPKAPDPVEEELKAPLKAAAPAPGSIGSAVSVPPEGGAAPAEIPTDANGENPMTAGAADITKKNSFLDKLMVKTKMSKKALIASCAVAGVIVLLLVIILFMLATGKM